MYLTISSSALTFTVFRIDIFLRFLPHWGLEDERAEECGRKDDDEREGAGVCLRALARAATSGTSESSEISSEDLEAVRARNDTETIHNSSTILNRHFFRFKLSCMLFVRKIYSIVKID